MVSVESIQVFARASTLLRGPIVSPSDVSPLRDVSPLNPATRGDAGPLAATSPQRIWWRRREESPHD